MVESVLGLILAFAVSRANRMAPFYRAVLLIPLLIPPIAIGTIWRMMYDYNFGVINRVLASVGIAGPTWLADPNLAFPAIWVVDFWHWTSFIFLIMLAGVESLPQDLFEAGRVDGASDFQIYRYIMLPLMRPDHHRGDDAAHDLRLQGIRPDLSAHQRRPGHDDGGHQPLYLQSLLRPVPHGVRGLPGPHPGHRHLGICHRIPRDQRQAQRGGPISDARQTGLDPAAHVLDADCSGDPASHALYVPDLAEIFPRYRHRRLSL